MDARLLTLARERAGLSKAELARRAATSREAVSAYEHGAKSPTLDTFDRLVQAAGFELALRPIADFEVAGEHRGAPILVPDRLPTLPHDQAFAVIDLPLHLEWSGEGRTKDLSIRADRIRVYELVLREGTPADVQRLIDPTLLIEAFEDLNLPSAIRGAWRPAITRWRGR
jgi:transcriptional regulator with XRE-family HTH domain